MNALIIAAAAPMTMSSREIGELTGSTHDNVLKTVRRLMAEGIVSGNETPYLHPQNGQAYKEIHLSFRDTMVVVSGYSAELRAKIIDRWQELEAGAAPALNLRDPKQMAAAAVQLLEINQELQARLAEAKPKIAFHDAVAEADSAQPVGEVAKVLGIGEKKLREFMRKTGIFMQRAPLPMQDQVDAGRFKVIERTFDDGKGFQKNYAKALVTGRGLQYLQRKLAEAGIHGGH